jgi:ubiquitin-activating enzyme E1
MSQFIDNSQDHRYSRQSYSIGQDAQTKLSNASVLVIGYNTLAQEIIRNMALIGVSNIDIFCDEKIFKQNHSRTGLYYPINDNTIPLDDLRKLNPTIKIDSVNILDEDNELDKKKIISKYNLLILTNSIINDSIDINRFTHKFNIPFIMCGTYGLMGYIFNDWCENFIINDLDGETHEPLIIESIDGKILKFKDEHKLSQGDTIIITKSDGSEIEFNVYRKKSPLLVELTEIPSQIKSDYLKILRKKISQTFNFESLKKNIDNPTHNVADWSVGIDRSVLLHKLNICVNKYFNEYGELPKSWSIPDWEIFSSKFVVELNLSESDLILAKKFCFTVRGDILPICSIIGGIVSHEVLKVLSHKYNPITQWYYMDYLDLIDNDEISSYSDYTRKNFKTKTKYDGLINVFGKRCLETIQNTVPFVIGSGAIGCELVKNLGMMGIKKIYLTDPDHIEKSNLSRQFLFSDNDLRQSKSETAGKKIKLMNPDVNVIALGQKICVETEDYFNDIFHSGIDIYLNALDNVEARTYMDTQAVKYSKPLIDSGTMGSKGNVQVIIPHLSETYGSSKDPDEKAGIPICTLKAFPYKPEHTIQWARELFETEFNLIPSFLNKYKNMTELENINDADSKQLLKQLYKYKDFELTTEYFNKLLGTILRENFHNNIKEIIDKYSKPENKEELGDKKLPEYLNSTNKDNIERIEFFKYGFKLLNQVFSSEIEFVCPTPDPNPDSNNNYHSFEYSIDELNSEQIIEILKPIINKVIKTNIIEFEKDDDELGHVQWIWLSSNMRNSQYLIPQTDLWETRKIAGNIIPALITTTSLISGFQILEFIRVIKLYQNNKYITSENKKDIDLYKNRFVNLNINYCDGINPSPTQNYKLHDNSNISVWTNFMSPTLNTQQIISQIESNTKKKIEFMTQGNKTVYDGDDISINTIEPNHKSSVLVLLEDIPIGIPILFN